MSLRTHEPLLQHIMAIELPDLPYSKDALAPHISAETLEFHHGKHHATYVTKVNDAVKGTPDDSKSLEELVMTTSGGLFNSAAQTWNHTFYWNCLAPNAGGEPPAAVKAKLEKHFGSFDDFKSKFSATAAGHFGSGWAWLVAKDGKLEVTDSHDAECPLTTGATPILTCDVWEHAYYIDFRNARPKYIEAFWALVNWDFVAANLESAGV